MMHNMRETRQAAGGRALDMIKNGFNVCENGNCFWLAGHGCVSWSYKLTPRCPCETDRNELLRLLLYKHRIMFKLLIEIT